MDMTIARNVGGRVRTEIGRAALDEAIRRVGGVRAMARALGNISVQAVSNWRACPPTRVLDVERVSGVSRHRLRPDVFGPTPKGR